MNLGFYEGLNMQIHLRVIFEHYSVTKLRVMHTIMEHHQREKDKISKLRKRIYLPQQSP